MVIGPTQGIRISNYSQPLLPVSCKRRKLAAYSGIARATARTRAGTVNRPVSAPKMAARIPWPVLGTLVQRPLKAPLAHGEVLHTSAVD